MNLKFNGRYDKKLFYEAVRVSNQSGNARALNLFAALGFAATTFLTARNLFAGGDWKENLAEIALMVLTGAVLLQSYLPSYFAARKLWKNPALQRPLRGVITEKDIRYQFDAGEKRYAWEEIRRARIQRDFVALVAKGGMLLIFPRRFFRREKDWQRFLTFLREKNPLILR